MKGFKTMFLLTALSICLCLTACSASTSDVNSTASSEQSQSDISAEQSADVSNETSQAVSEDKAESADLSLQPTESNDISEDIDTSEESAPVQEPSEDEISAVPPTESTEPEPDISKPAEDVSKPAEDISKPEEDTSSNEPTDICNHIYTTKHTYPSCTEDGSETTLCKLCGEVESEKIVPKYGHDFSEWTSGGSTYFTYHDVNNGYAVITLDEAMDDIRHLLRYCKRCRYGEVMDKEGCITPDDAEWICNRIIELLNEERAKLGAPALSTAPIAHEMAMVRAQELTVVFSHKRPDGNDSATIYIDYNYNPDRTGYMNYNGEMVKCAGPERSSENICGGVAPKNDTKENFAQRIVQNFKESPGHWKDLTNPEYTGVGVGVCFVDEGASSWFYDCPVAILTMDKTYG